MKKTVRSPGSATIINAIATGFGSAFGIGLDIKCEAKTIANSIKCVNDVGADTELMEMCVERVFSHYDIDSDDFGISLKTKSDLPMAKISERAFLIKKEVINEKYGRVPYLNSSLFEVSSLEKGTIRISNLENHDLPLFGGTVLRDF